MTIAVDPMHADQIEAVDTLAAEAGFTLDATYEFGLQTSLLLVAREGHAAVGFVCARVAGDQAEITELSTASTWRRRGVARALLEKLDRVARSEGVQALFLEVRASNRPAIALYAQHGFRTTHRRARYYRNPSEDALCMTITLK